MLNKVLLQGRLVSAPELKQTQSGIAVASFRIAVEQDFKNKETGERKADFINVVAWRQTGEFVSRYFAKGNMAVIDGKLSVRQYQDKDGNKRYATEVVADNVHFCGSKDGGQKQSYATYDAPQTQQFTDITDDDDDLPF